MSNKINTAIAEPDAARSDEKLISVLKCHYRAISNIRRGICCLNAGRFEEAEASFRSALNAGATGDSLPTYLAGALIGQRRPRSAADILAHSASGDQFDHVSTIRHALALFASGQTAKAEQVLRDGIAAQPECAELHFQLGTILAATEHCEEAELRFVQAINIDREHTEARISLAMCCGVRGAMNESLQQLQRAHALRPQCPRIGLLLAQAARAAREQGCAVHVRPTMLDRDDVSDQQGLEELSRVIEAEPDFVDAFLAIPQGEVDEEVFAMLLQTLQMVLERQPEHAELHYHCGRVHERLGHHLDAIDHNERAVHIEPKFIRALIELGKLYRKTDRMADARTRLEQAIAAGAEYADVYYLLGNLYRDLGLVGRARTAYRRALLINDRYHDAREALQALPV